MTRDFTEKDIADLLRWGDIRIVEDDGLRCQIGEYSFFFEGNGGDELSLDEYLDNYSTDVIAEHIYNTVKDERTAEDNGIYASEYGYYAWTIISLLKQHANDITVSDITMLLQSEKIRLIEEYGIGFNILGKQGVRCLIDNYSFDFVNDKDVNLTLIEYKTKYSVYEIAGQLYAYLYSQEKLSKSVEEARDWICNLIKDALEKTKSKIETEEKTAVFYRADATAWLSREDVAALVEYAASGDSKIPDHVQEILNKNFGDGYIPGPWLEDLAREYNIPYQGGLSDIDL